MKFTKLTGLVLTTATVLGALALSAPTLASAKTVEGNAEVNGGQALPQNGQTTAGISFGQPTALPNTGYLRLQAVPNILDFGNHETFDAAFPSFNANGENIGKTGNNQDPSYQKTGSNLTAILNTTDAELTDVNGKVWATVVDKQDSRTQAEADKDTTGNTDTNNGDWVLNVKANGPLALQNDAGEATATTTDATIAFNNTAAANTAAVYDLTRQTEDEGYVPAATPIKVTDVAKTVVVNVSDADVQHQVAAAATGEGAGANVFGWKKNDIRLVLPASFTAENGVYTTDLTWTLSTGL